MQRKFQTFLQLVKSSIFDIEFYKSKVVKYPTSKGILYLFSLQYLLMMLTVLMITVSMIISLPKAIEQFKSAAPVIASVFPPDLQLRLENGKLSHNQKNPLIVDLNPSVTGFDAKAATGGKSDHFLIIDTSENVDESKVSSILLLTQDSLVIQGNVDRNVIPLNQLMVLWNGDKYGKYLVEGALVRESLVQMLTDLVNILQAWKWGIMLIGFGVFVVLFSVISVVMTLLLTLALMLLSALVLLILKLIFGKQTSFQEVYLVAAFASTTPILLQFFFPQTVGIGVFVLILLVYMIFIWQQIYKAKSA